MLRSLLVIVLSALPCLALADEPLTITQQQIAEILEPIRAQHELPALAAAVVASDGTTVVAAVGVRKAGDKTPVTSDDKFHLGSCTKAMTSTLVALYAERGKLGWDDTLDKLFPALAGEMTPEAKRITLSHLLCHHSGLLDLSIEDFHNVAKKGSAADQRVECLKLALSRVKQKGLDSEPGKKFLYTNLGYIVAAAAIEQIAGKDWETLIEAEVFRPLGIATAGNGSMATPGKIDQPWSHLPDGKPVEPGPRGDNPQPLGPAGRIHASMADWGKFAIDQMNEGKPRDGLPKPLLTTESYQRLHTPLFAGSSYTPGGWGRGKQPQGAALGHDGSNLMNYCSGMIFLDQGIAILVACSQGPNDDPKGDGKAGCHEARAALQKAIFDN